MQVIFRFPNFYQRFIQRFSWIDVLLILILETLSTELIELKKGIVGVACGNKEHGDRAKLVCRDEFGGNKVDSNKVGNNKVEKNHQKIFKFIKLSKSKKIQVFSNFFTFKA